MRLTQCTLGAKPYDDFVPENDFLPLQDQVCHVSCIPLHRTSLAPGVNACQAPGKIPTGRTNTSHLTFSCQVWFEILEDQPPATAICMCVPLDVGHQGDGASSRLDQVTQLWESSDKPGSFMERVQQPDTKKPTPRAWARAQANMIRAGKQRQSEAMAVSTLYTYMYCIYNYVVREWSFWGTTPTC